MMRKMKTMDWILVFVAFILIVFTIVMICLYRETGAIPDTLCACVFSVLGTECGAMAWIKTTKDKYIKEAEPSSEDDINQNNDINESEEIQG